MENPATDTTTPSYPRIRWKAEPNQRGTSAIASLCASTLIICIWSAVHYNIPIRRYTDTRRFFLQASWMLIALLGPEVLLFLAINESITAHNLLEEVRKVHPDLAEPRMFTRMYNWVRGTFTRMYNWTRVTFTRMYNWIRRRSKNVSGQSYAMP